MKVAMDIRAIPKSGIGVYCRILSAELPKNGRKVKAYICGRESNTGIKGFWNKLGSSLKRAVVRQVELAKLMHTEHIDIYHNLRNVGVPLYCGGKIVVTIHDIIPHVLHQYYLKSFIERFHYEISLKWAIWRSDAIITISEFSKAELLKYYAVDKNKIYVIPQGCSENYTTDPSRSMLARKKYNIRRPYIMTMGGSEYRKNVKTVLKAYDKNFAGEYDLVVIGGAWREVNLSKKYQHDPRVKFLQGISDEDLQDLYNGAEVFVFASIYEGFGIPMLEAMHCGTPVIAANASCLLEVAGEAALYFEPLDAKDLSRVLKKILTDKELRARMIARGYIRMKLYSWDKTVQQTYEVYKQLLGHV